MLGHSLAGTEPHRVLELLAYAVGGRLYWRAAARAPEPPPAATRALLLGAALFGALAGGVSLHDLQHLDALHRQGAAADWFAGKSVLGALLGATGAVELAKRATGWRRPTGDAWVLALTVGLVLGRAGCQLSGTWDLTYGVPTALPWAWDYGDGIGRHPVGLYEMLLVALAGAAALAVRGLPAGARFAAFLLGYCLIRLGLEWLKPPFGAAAEGALPVATAGGLTAIQWAAAAGCAGAGLLLRRRLRGGRPA